MVFFTTLDGDVSDEDFEVIDQEDNGDGLAQSMEKLSLEGDEETSLDSCEFLEIALLRGTISEMDEEITRLKQTNEELRGANETLKWKVDIMEKVVNHRRELLTEEEEMMKEIMEIRERRAEEKLNELSSQHRVELLEKQQQIARLTLINERQKESIEAVKRKVLWKLDELQQRREAAAKMPNEALKELNAMGASRNGLKLQLNEKIAAKNSEALAPPPLRTLSFLKIESRFGAGHNGRMITVVEEGGPADRAGLRVGDELISINDIDVFDLPSDEITRLSEDVPDDVTLVVRFRPERLREMERSKIPFV